MFFISYNKDHIVKLVVRTPPQRIYKTDFVFTLT